MKLFCETARLPLFLNLTTSRTQQFCQTSSIFEVDNVKNEAILRDFLNFPSWQDQKRSNSARLPSKMELSAELMASYQCVLHFFHSTSTCLKYCACHEKVMPGHTKCCTCHAKSSSQNWRSDAPKCNPSQEISALISYLMCLLYCACQAQCIFPDPLQIFHACDGCWNCYKTLQFCSLLTRCTIPCACHEKRHLNVLKSSVPLSFCAFDFEMCFVHNGVCSFPHLNFQKWYDPWCVSCILTWTCALRHNGVQLFISHLARWLRTRRFSEPTFRHPEPQIIGKTHCFAAFLPFRAPGSSFFGDFLFFDLLSSSLLFSDSSISAFYLSILSEVWLLNFLR